MQPPGLWFVIYCPQDWNTYRVTQPLGSTPVQSGIWDVGGLSAGGNVSLTINARATSANQLTNTAEVFASDQWDPNSTPNNNVPGENDRASQVIGATQIDLSVGKTVDNPTPNLNDTITFTVLVSNAGPSDATGG